MIQKLIETDDDLIPHYAQKTLTVKLPHLPIYPFRNLLLLPDF